jgi:hypothetical protein
MNILDGVLVGCFHELVGCFHEHSGWCSADETGIVCLLEARRRLCNAIPCQVEPSLPICHRAS